MLLSEGGDDGGKRAAQTHEGDGDLRDRQEEVGDDRRLGPGYRVDGGGCCQQSGDECDGCDRLAADRQEDSDRYRTRHLGRDGDRQVGRGGDGGCDGGDEGCRG